MVMMTLNEAREPVPCNDPVTWALWVGENNRRVAYDELPQATVSTVFLGIDTIGGPFETMVFGDRGERRAAFRYQTWADAEAGHASIVRAIKEQAPQGD